MNWAWASSLDQFWRSPTFPVWLTLAAAGFFGIIVLITLLRAEKSVANGALTVITLLAVGIASAATIRGFDPGGRSASGETPPPPVTAALPALSCIDDLAGEMVLTACEKSLFGSAESTAAALSYAASQITRLTSFGDVAAANKNLTPELQVLRRAVERDRYGLMAYVLLARDHCSPSDCAAFRAVTDRQQLVSNMDERVYEGLVMRYAASWNAPAPAAAPAVAALAPSMPTGKPTNADFPSAASTPPVSIMTPEPGAGTASAAPRSSASMANAPPPSQRPPASANAPAAVPALASAKKQPAPKQHRASAPVQLSPAAPPVAAAPAPAAANE
jgi:hypothetical protein